MLTLILVILAAVVFEYSNGFHDAANAIATVVSTRVLRRAQAIAMAAFFNFPGALVGGAVAATIGKGLVDTEVVADDCALCCDSRLQLEHCHLGDWAYHHSSHAPDRRSFRRRARCRERRLVSNQMERRCSGQRLCCL